MISSNNVVKLIFGFKIKHLRIQLGKSYQELSNETGLSVSYLNDIERGKKYPKPDKIQTLAKAFKLSYDELVSTQSDKKLQPIIELLSSDFFKFFPLEEFGISLEKLLDVFSGSPNKFSAFISTILKMIRNYQIEKEHFYRIALRSYQDIHNNNFPQLETDVSTFKRTQKLRVKAPIEPEILATILLKEYNITINTAALSQKKNLNRFRSYFKESTRVLYLNKGLSSAQKRFLLAKEIGFQYLNLTERPYETYLNKEASFEKLLSNFKASYFSAALLIDQQELVKDLHLIARSTTWKTSLLLNLLEKYDVTPEMLLQRFTNILPSHFNINNLFFIRLNSTSNLTKYTMTKELHLSQLHNPYQTELDEHLCNRWVSVSAIKSIRAKKGNYLIDAQISNYWQNPNSYFCISIAQSSSFNNTNVSSVTLGLLMTEKLRATFNFLKDPKLKEKTVHTTCERCAIPDCDNRVAAPIIIDNALLEHELEEALESL